MLPIIYSGNKGIFDGVLISLLSVIENTSDTVNVYIFTMDLAEQNEKFLPITPFQCEYLDNMCKEKNPDSFVKLVDVGEYYKESLIDSPNTKTSYTPYTFLRLYADRVDYLPDKVLYLDTDTICAKDISELVETDISNYEFAGSLDYYGKHFISPDYINAGVLLLNLKKIRETGLFRKCLDMLKEKKIFLPDQTALNKMAESKLIIDGIFNEQKDYKDDNTVIQHFAKTIKWIPYFHTKNIKPWHTEKVKKELTDKYNKILDIYEQRKKDFKEIINE